MSETQPRTVLDLQTARERRREALARLIWSELGGLVQDPLGESLPAVLWQKALQQADGVLALIGARSVVGSEDR